MSRLFLGKKSPIPLFWQLTVTILVCSLFAQSALANPMFISPGTESASLGPHVYYLEDATQKLSVRDLIYGEHDWKKNKKPTVNLGFTRSAYWFRVSIQNMNIGDGLWVLEQSYGLIDRIQLYVVRGGETVDYRETGDTFPVKNRPIHHSKFLFPIELPPNSISDVYIRVENTEAMEITLKLWKQETFQINDRKAFMVDGFFYGLFAVMALYNLVIFFSVKEKAYIFYVFYVVCSMFFVGTQKGHFFLWFYPDSPVFHHYSIPIVIVMLMGSILLFFEHFLDVRKASPRVFFLLNGLMLVMIASTLGLPYLHYSIIISFIMVMLVILASLSFLVVGSQALKGRRTAQVFLAGWITLVVCGLFLTFAKLGLVRNEFIANYGLQAAFSFEIILFSLALSLRINEAKEAKLVAEARMEEEREERIKAEGATLQKERELRRAREDALEQQRKLNENLENTVKERTIELEKTMEHLNKVNAELEELSVKDGLTGVYNRRFFDRKAEEEWDRAMRSPSMLTLMLLDLDHFKAVNDNRGHQCGDKVLQLTAQAISDIACRPADIVARYGGEEFVVLLPSTTREGAEHVAGLLVKHVADQQIFYDGELVPVTISIGLASLMPTISEKLEDMINSADEALYQSKENGRNRYTVAKNI
ncbi:hypothetical protein A9Q99_09705 [Gammaproteobacteria bacterium 45_16_T64]|nr:hypothetical protein A9Q99_09705 [Gammaproteobacteria bacterium 45_16_T64]